MMGGDEYNKIEFYGKALKLSSIMQSLKSLQQDAIKEKWTYEMFLNELLRREYDRREEQRKQRQVRAAGFPQQKHLEDLDREELPQDMQTTLPELERLDFIKECHNIILYGNPGTGKTHCAIGLGIKACLAGYSVLYTSVPHLLTQIRECESARKLGKLQKKFEKYDLVICDEFGYKSFDKQSAEALFNHISLRAGRKSTIITTNLGFDKWEQIFTDKVIAAAIVDRLTYQSYIINMNGASYRLKSTERWLKERKKK